MKTDRERSSDRMLPWPILAALGALAAVGVVTLIATSARGTSQAASDPGPIHVHGLGIDPADGALFIATHSGLWRAAESATRATRVGDRYQDTMGFTIAGPNRFLGSGHPDPREARELGLPARLGLIESSDGGKSWKPISLSGEADFHVLRLAGSQLLAYDASSGRLLMSRDQGRTWSQLGTPGPLVDIVADPSDPKHLVATTSGGLSDGLIESRDGGETWDQVGELVGLLAWPTPDRLLLLTDTGDVYARSDRARRLAHAGTVGSPPAAFHAASRDELYVALHDGTVQRSTDAGRTWVVRSTP